MSSLGEWRYRSATIPSMDDFSKVAERYDNGLLGRISQPFYRETEAAAAPYLAPGTRVLDVGCGTGALLSRLVERHQINGTGVDPSLGMAEVAKGAHPDLTIVSGAAEALPFTDDSFDLVISCLSYHHFADQEQFLAEVNRVLQPGGRLLIAEPNLPRVICGLLNLSTRIIRHSETFETPDELAAKLSSANLTAEVVYRRKPITVVCGIAA